MEFVLAPEFRPFSIAGAIMLGLLAVELLTLLGGVSLSHLVEKSFDFGPDVDGPDVDAGGHHGSVMNWLNVGGVPFLVLVVLILAYFSITGFIIQEIAKAIITPLPVWIAVAAAAFVTIPATRASTRTIARIIPRDESYAISLTDLVGRVGKVAHGPIDQGLPGTVHVRDDHANLHTIRARAAADAPDMPNGSDVLLVDLVNGSVFTAIPAPAELGDGKSVTTR